MFANDRDLLVYEPGLFDDVAWIGQRLVDGLEVALSGDGLTLLRGSGSWVDDGVGVGSVVVLEGLGAVEVVSVVSAVSLGVSRLRAGAASPAIPVRVGGWTGGARVSTFSPQLAATHGLILNGLGVVEGEAPEGGDGRVYASQILNGGDLVRAECLGALHLVYSAASSLVGEASVSWTKALMYRDRFGEERQRVAVEIDTDGDGAADVHRRVNALRLVRG